jgi:hypothetical protein
MCVYSDSGSTADRSIRSGVGGSGGGCGIGVVGGANSIRRIRDSSRCATSPLERFESCPSCANTCRHVLRRAEFTSARRYRVRGAVNRLSRRSRAAAAAPWEQRRIALMWVVLLVRLMVVVLLHLAPRTADGRRSGVRGKDRIGWFCVWVQGSKRFPAL